MMESSYRQKKGFWMNVTSDKWPWIWHNVAGGKLVNVNLRKSFYKFIIGRTGITWSVRVMNQESLPWVR